MPARLRRVIAGIAVVVCVPLIGYARSSQSSGRTVILQVVRDSWYTERDETLIYLRVYSDGFAETHPMRKVDFRDLQFASKLLSADQLAALKRVLYDTATIQLQANYSRNWGYKDFGYKYTVTISGQSGKRLELVNFQPFLARKEGKPYPKQLERLGCSIWRLRAEVSGEALEKDWLNGCKELGY